MRSDIAEMYFLLAETDNNNHTIMRNSRKRAFLTVGILFDLQLNHITTMTKSSIAVTTPLPKEYGFLNPIIDIIDDRHTKSIKNVLRHVALNRRINQAVYDGIGERLFFKNQVVKTTTRGLVFSHDKFTPKAPFREAILTRIRHEFLENQPASVDLIALVSLLSGSRLLKNYFDQSELKQLGQRVHKLQQEPQFTDLFNFTKWINDYIRTMIVAAASSGNN